MRFLVSSLTIALFLTPMAASANCGSASCPLNNDRYLGAGGLFLTLHHEYINLDEIYVGSSRSHVGALANTHDEISTLSERTIVAGDFGLSDRFSLHGEIPFVHREHIHRERTTDGFANEYWNFEGMGDAILSLRYTPMFATTHFAPSLALTAGLKLANGATGVTNGAGERAEVTLQPGTGSTDFLLGLNYRQNIASVPAVGGAYSALPLLAGVLVQIPGNGTEGYRFGNSVIASAGTAYQFAARGTFLFQLNYRWQDHADPGSTGEFASNTGGSWLFASPGLSIELSDAFSAEGYVQLPLYQNLNGIQQAAPYYLRLGISANLDLNN